MATLPEQVKKAIGEPQFWTLATVNPDGSPQASIVWVDERDGKILVNTALGRRKPRNLEANGRVALAWYDPNQPYSNAMIQGRVADSYTGDQAEADIDGLAKKYIGQDVYPYRAEGERRITFLIEPEYVTYNG